MNNDIRTLLMALESTGHEARLSTPTVSVPIRVGHIDWTMEHDGASFATMHFALRNTTEPVSKKVSYRSYYDQNRNKIDKSKPGWAIKQVIFSDPATIVLWHDGTKTVVKCENEAYDPEKGLAMALAKKMLGNKGNYFDVFKKWLPEDYETPKKVELTAVWKIWFKEYDENGKFFCHGVHNVSYKRKNDATRIANKVYGDKSKYEFIVSMANPWKEV